MTRAIQRDPRSGVTLGVRRLSVIDIEGGHQPLSNEDDSVWAALNGEIYNHPALLARLRESRAPARVTFATRRCWCTSTRTSRSSSCTLSRACSRSRSGTCGRQTLILARDRFGEKPLFFHEHDGELAFASELTALLAGLPHSGELDPAAVDALLRARLPRGRRDDAARRSTARAGSARRLAPRSSAGGPQLLVATRADRGRCRADRGAGGRDRPAAGPLGAKPA